MARSALIVALVSAWGLRLGIYLAWRRVREKGEDFRYRRPRERYGRRFPLASLFVVFGFRGLGMWTVSLPVQAGQVPATATGLTALDLTGAALWVVRMSFESVADLQLARFRSDPRNRGKVMDRGLWRYSRHPNYFGEFCVWWGLFLIAIAAGAPWWVIAGPVAISFVLLASRHEYQRRRPGAPATNDRGAPGLPHHAPLRRAEEERVGSLVRPDCSQERPLKSRWRVSL